MHFANILILIYALPKFIFAMPPPPDLSGPAPTTWPDCQQSLSCTFAAIQSSSLAARLTYIQNMQSDFFADELKCPTQWRAIEGVIEFFQSKDQGAPGTWVSYTDAGIIEAVQRGGAIALGLSNEDGGNPGSQLWADFMTNMKNGKLDDRSKHDYAWSIAEQASTDYGKSKGDAVAPPPSTQVKRWFQFTQIFRAMMRNRSAILAIVNSLDGIPGVPVVSWIAGKFFDWFTDITQVTPTRCGADSSWTLSALDVPPMTPEQWVKDEALLAKILPAFVICYVKNIL